MEGFECCGDGRESDGRLGFAIEYKEVVKVNVDLFYPSAANLVAADGVLSTANLVAADKVAADRLKAVRRKLVPADNLKRSVTKALLLKL
ncbi:hypothetical protein L1987_20379 [Smallanthus sonchifolius]|uniref:Uncharacterized protein n=1 Tax=Smallanthus sonchifolius TaxID=185202 RepID=A0ACB9IRM7_9ASTR|nr:hypothetical protein L1987_20379 [Smallanthus sonchifolius]